MADFSYRRLDFIDQNQTENVSQ